MNSETRLCQNCKSEFVIKPDDFAFYERIKMPFPTFCPECRSVRRMTWRNERTLYKRICEKTGKQIVSCFAPDSGIHVYDRDVWWSDEWDPISFGREYDFSRSFFSQFGELLQKVPMPSVFNGRCVRSNYSNHSGELKDSYFVFASWGAENLLYSSKIISGKDSSNLLVVNNSELCYEVMNSSKLYRVAYAENCENCNDSYFLYGCRGCNNCVGCVNLRNKSYYIFDEPYSKEEYFKKIETLELESASGVERLKEKFKVMKKGSLRKYANIMNSQNTTGDNLTNVSNCKECFDLADDVRNCGFCINGGIKMYDSYDGYGVGANAELLYESIDTGADGSRLWFDIFVWTGNDVQYCYACHGCQNCFGCIGLRKKEYCILNKQYSKEAYQELVPRIIAQMNVAPYKDKKGNDYKYGEFFPSELSPFAYNETIAQEYFPLTKETAVEREYRWKDAEAKNYAVTMYSEKIPDRLSDVSDDILRQVIECAHKGKCTHQCATAFRIIPEELQFYRRMKLPIPRICPNCRHYEQLAERNPVKLWHRKCTCLSLETSAKESGYRNTTVHFHGESPCPNEFETPYAPERPETVYCEQCYQAEVV